MSLENTFNYILQMQAISTVFQPIVSLETGVVFGYEALSRSTSSNKLNIEDLFKTALQEDRLWELEKLCRTKALQNAALQRISSVLFINVDVNIIHDLKFQSGFTVERLKEYGISPENVIIELTEKSAIQDINGFITSVKHYKRQGFKIAIDDFGSGYSGLNRVCELSPEFLKIDMNLIRNINTDPIKCSAVSSTVEFCRQAGIRVIAEGIESLEELKTVIRLGVEFGQGYFISRPHSEFKDIPKDCRDTIMENYSRTCIHHRLYSSNRVVDLGISSPTASMNSSALDLFEKMKHDSELSEFFVVDENGTVRGIIPRYHVFERFGGQYGYVLSQRMHAEDIMLTDFLVVEEHLPVEKVSDLAMNRNLNRVYESIAISSNGKYLNSVTVRDLLLASINLQLQKATDANPLTNLPGNHEIQRMIETIFSQNVPWSIIYIDLDNFKAYNDAYGFSKGDAMLKALADVMRRCAGKKDFLGHIGGDDFVIISPDHEVLHICQHITNEFHRDIEQLYSTHDWRQGVFVSKNRSGFPQSFIIASLSIAVVTNRDHQPKTIDELSSLIANTKKQCKMQLGNAIVIV
ncbi:MAG: GGDEF domain-containing protein [Erysipelotrichaceae bacterium]|nr:GGDEF domain-containing protein [Erysipelotrichaceae bacterium]